MPNYDDYAAISVEIRFSGCRSIAGISVVHTVDANDFFKADVSGEATGYEDAVRETSVGTHTKCPL